MHFRPAKLIQAFLVSVVLISAIFDLMQFIILSYSSPLLLLSNLDLSGLRFQRFFMYPHINSVNQEMQLFSNLFDNSTSIKPIQIYHAFSLLLRPCQPWGINNGMKISLVKSASVGKLCQMSWKGCSSKVFCSNVNRILIP